jgi:uncharacterized protein (TIGR02118 family)
MHKLVILIEQQEDWTYFESQWPDFLHLAESMPGVKREATSRVERLLYGECHGVLVHEIFFDTLIEAETALASPAGQAAGRLIQQITGGRMTIFFADHKEDEIANIRKYRQPDESAE